MPLPNYIQDKQVQVGSVTTFMRFQLMARQVSTLRDFKLVCAFSLVTTLNQPWHYVLVYTESKVYSSFSDAYRIVFRGGGGGGEIESPVTHSLVFKTKV